MCTCVSHDRTLLMYQFYVFCVLAKEKKMMAGASLPRASHVNALTSLDTVCVSNHQMNLTEGRKLENYCSAWQVTDLSISVGMSSTAKLLQSPQVPLEFFSIQYCH